MISTNEMNNFINPEEYITVKSHESLLERNKNIYRNVIEAKEAEIKRLRELLTDARRVLDWGEPEPKPVLRRIEAALAGKEDE